MCEDGARRKGAARKGRLAQLSLHKPRWLGDDWRAGAGREGPAWRPPGGPSPVSSLSLSLVEEAWSRPTANHPHSRAP